MNRSRILLLLFSLSLLSCATQNTFTPVEAVVAAAETSPGVVTGVFELTIKGTGRQGEFIYLNSEADYRDQRNLTLEIHPGAVPDFVAKYGAEPDAFLKGKTLRVSGDARRVTIWFTSNGERTEKYYYQTHVRVTNESQIEIL